MKLRRGVVGVLLAMGLVGSALATGVAEAATPPPNDAFSKAQVLPAQLSGSVTGTTIGATTEVGEPIHGGFSGDQTVWYRYTALRTATTYFAVPDQTETLRGAIAVYRGTAVGSLTPIAYENTDTRTDFFGTPEARFAATAGVTYSIAISTSSSNANPTIPLSWRVGGAPPSNDAFSNAQTLSITPTGMVQGTTTDATAEPAEWAPCRLSVWYRFTPSVSGVLGMSSDGFANTQTYAGPPLVTISRGSSLGSLVQLGSSDIEDWGSVSDIPVTAGTTYYVSVSCGYSKFDGPDIGPFDLSWDFNPTQTGSTNSFSVLDARTSEGHDANFRVTRAGDISGDATVDYSIQNGTALAGSDYAVGSVDPLYFSAGQTTAWAHVQTIADSLGEPNETFKLTLSSPVGGVLADSTAQAVITDAQFNEPTYSIGDVSVKEGSTATFTITRRGDLTQPGSVKAASASGAATSPGDFTALTSTTVSFAAGQSTRTVSVTTKQNTVNVTTNKTFNVNLSSPVNGWTSDTSATATIVDDEGTVIAGSATWYAVDGVRVTEGGTAIVTVRRRGTITGTGSVRYATADGSATAGSDYTAVPLTTANFAAGQATATFSVPTAGDTRGEVHESVLVNLSTPIGGAIEDSQGVISIQDNDDNPGPPQITVNNVRVTEGSAAVFTIIRAGDVSESVSVKYATANGTATSGSDFTSKSSTTLTFASGEWIKTVSVSTLTDTRAEGDESFYLNLSSPTNATIVDNTGTATVANKG